MISADVKCNIKQQEIKKLVAACDRFLEEVPSKLQYNVKRVCIFLLILVFNPS